MKRVLKWLALTLVTVVVLALIGIYGGSEYQLRRRFAIAAAPIPITTDAASIANGQHIFETRGCTGCHGEGATGKVFFDEPWIARLVAPNVSKVIKSYSDPDLARLFRHGVRPNGSGVAVMPSSMFYHLDDRDLASLVAYVRTIPEREGDATPPTSMRILARIGLLTGQYKLEPLNIVHTAPRAPNAADGPALGRYLAMSSCTECHGAKLAGDAATPSLAIVAGYSPDEFAKLMREGVPKDGRTMELMTPTSKNRFSHFTPTEVAGLYAYLSKDLPAGKD